MINFEYLRTTTVASALSLSAKDKRSRFIAGGTNLVDLMKKGVTAPEKLIDINHIPLKEIKQVGNILHIGALTTNAAVADHALVQKHLPVLAMALKAGASAQLRNMATVGGNMMQRTRCGYFYDTAMPCNKREPGSGCGAIGGFNRMHAIFGASDKCIAVHPSDMCVALAALDATVVVQTGKQTRRIKFTDFHKLPGTNPELDNILAAGELITGVEIPIPKPAKAHYLKIRERASYAFALVSVAVVLETDRNDTILNVRLAMGGVAHKPWRLTEAEAFLKGKNATIGNFEAAAALAMKGSKGQGENDFKLKMAPNAIVEALHSAKTSA